MLIANLDVPFAPGHLLRAVDAINVASNIYRKNRSVKVGFPQQYDAQRFDICTRDGRRSDKIGEMRRHIERLLLRLDFNEEFSRRRSAKAGEDILRALKV